MKAWLDLTERKANGEHVNSRDIRKHRQDIFRLFPLISRDVIIEVPSEVYDDIQTFLSAVEVQSFDSRSIGLEFEKNEVLSIYRQIYQTQQ